jgi:uncharacterized membrane protein YbhN (UPF0104 family)
VWASVLYERLVGLAAMLSVALAALALSPKSLGGRASLVPPVALAVVIGLVIVLPPRVARVARRLRDRVGVWALRVEALAAAFAGPLSRPRVVAEIFAISVVSQILLLGALYFPARSLGIAEPALVVFLGVPIVFTGAVLPVTFGGHGLRESLFVLVLGLLGVDATRALSLAMIWLGLNVAYALFGVGFLVLGRAPGPLQRQNTDERLSAG